MLLDRGGCNFAQKILNAQKVNAIGAIVADTNGLCYVSPECGYNQCSQCPLGTTNPQCSCFLPYMAGGPGSNEIVIPSFMISRDDAAIIRPLATPGPVGQLYASMAWDIPNRNGNVEYQLWLDSNDALSYQFRMDFQPYVPYLATAAVFTPRFYIWDGRAAGCGTVWDCSTQCINNGYYCNIDPDGDLFKGISGADIVMEHLREICIWQEVNKTYSQDYGMRWWNYAQYFSERCNDPITWNRYCSELCMIDADIDVNNVRQCVLQSNSSVRPSQNDYTNILLQEALNLRNEMAIVVLPSAVVNDVILRGGTSPVNLLTAICGGFGGNNQVSLPPVCNCINVPISELPACIANSNNNNNNNNNNDLNTGLPGWGKALISIVVLGLIGSIIGGVYIRNRTKQEVQEMLDDYVALMGDEDIDNNSNNNNNSGTSSSSNGRKPFPSKRSPSSNNDRNIVINTLINKLSSLLTPPPSGQQFTQLHHQQQQQQYNNNNRSTIPAPSTTPATTIIGSTITNYLSTNNNNNINSTSLSVPTIN